MITTQEYIKTIKEFNQLFGTVPEYVNKDKFLNMLQFVNECHYINYHYVKNTIFNYLLFNLGPIDWRDLDFMIACDQILGGVSYRTETLLDQKFPKPKKNSKYWEKYYNFLIKELNIQIEETNKQNQN